MEHSIKRIPLRIALVYLVIAVMWVLLSDNVLNLLILPDTEPQLFAVVQTLKGWLFVLITAVLLYLLLRSKLAHLQTETAVRSQLQQEMHSLLQAMPLALVQIDPDGIVQYWNRPAEQMFGWTAQEAHGRVLPYVGPEQQQEFAALTQRVLNGEVIVGVEVERQTKAGERIFLNLSIAPVRAADGKISGITSISRDITEQKMAQTALLEKELRYRSLVEFAPNAIFVNHSERLVLANQACLQLFGADHEEQLLGKSPYELFHPDYHQPIRQRIHQLRVEGQPVPAVEEKIVRLDGRVVDVEVSAAPFPYEGSIALHVILRDVTARKQAERHNYLLLALPNIIADAPSLESALEAALGRVCESVGCDLGEVWIPAAAEDALSGSLKLLAQYHQHPELDAAFWSFSQPTTFAPGEDLPGRVWAAQEVVWIPNLAGDPAFARVETAVQLGFEVAIGLPILLNNSPIAVMCFFLRGARPKEDHLVSLMSGVAVQIAAAFQRKQYQEKLSEAQRLAQATIDSLSAHIAVLDEDGVIIAVNQSWLDFAHANHADLSRVGVGVNYVQICEAAAALGEEEAVRILAGIRAVMGGQKATMTLEYPSPAPHAPRWFAIHVTPLPGDDPGRRRVVVAHENITSLKQAELALRDSEQHYRLLFDDNPQPMWVYDVQMSTFLAVNDAAVEKYGYSRAEFLSLTLAEVESFSEATPSDVGRSGERRHRLKDGRLLDVEIAAHELNFNGRAAVLAVAFDITERKQLAADRLAQTRRLQEIVDTVPEGVVLLAESGQVMLANPQGRRLLFGVFGWAEGQPVQGVNGLSLPQLLTTNGRGASHAVHKDDRYYELLARPITPGRSGSNWVLLLRDVTEDHEREQYQQAQDRLATVGQLAAGIAHDFNNVLAVIILYAQMLESTVDLSPKDQDTLSTIIDQAQHAADMIAQILDFSRRSMMERTPIAVLPLLKEMLKLLQNTLPENIEIGLHSDAEDYMVLADPTRLRQALMNTAVNSRDAMPHGGELRFAVTALTFTAGQPLPLPDMAPGDWLRVTISDSGVGIPPENLPRIFDPFFTTKAPGKGTGLGLAQLYGIVKQHDGSVSVDSRVGEGTTITIYLPRFVAQAKEERSAASRATAPSGTETILLVEDNPKVLASVVAVLAQFGYNVLPVQNGLEALDVLAQNDKRVDLVLSDMVMPEMGGLELQQSVKLRYPDLPLLLMTGYPLGEQDPGLTGAAWIMKPFDSSELGRKIRALLDVSPAA
ncbi:MAG: PAS domain S-box protein [Ardenticatenaceae bacterium]|nr:PAS domain S-box protein [Ardenticatenaceae bacterium]